MYAYSGENYNQETTQTTGSPFSQSTGGEHQWEGISLFCEVSVDTKVTVRRTGQAGKKLVRSL